MQLLRRRALFPALLLFPLPLAAQTPDNLQTVLERLDRLERQNRELMDEIRALRAELQPARPAEAAGAPTLEQKVEIHERRIEEQAQTKVEASQKFPIRLTGMALFNAFTNSRQNGGADYPTIASATGPGRAGATVRQTVIGLDFRGPQTFWGGQIRGNVYMDFSSGTAPLSQTMRLRTASIEAGWTNRSFIVGVEKPIFNPREPSSLAQVAISPLTGAGNLWLWLPQARFEQDIALGAGNGIRATMGVVQTREVGPYAASQQPANLEASRPGLEGRFEFFHNSEGERRIEFAPGFHVSTTHIGGFSIPSQIVSADWFFRPIRRLEFSGAFFRGENVAHLGTGAIRQGYGIDNGVPDAVHSQGGWGQLTIHTLPRLDFHLFTGQQDDKNADVPTGGIGKNLVYGGNIYFRVAPNVLVGWETSQTRTVYVGQPTRINNHYDLAVGYLF